MITTQRIFWPQYNSPEKLDRLFNFLGRHRELSNEISFFTEGDATDWRYLPPEEVEHRAQFLASAVQKAREAGFVPVINVLNTLGHSDEGGPEAPTLPWRGMMDFEGHESRVCSCPADERFLDYVRFKYEAFAGCRADRYWIDDDVRMHNHAPAKWGCFCPVCVEDFSRRVDVKYDRPTLSQALLSDRSIREGWIQRNGEVFFTLLKACAEGVGRGHPGADIGLMTGDAVALADIDVDFSGWFRAMTEITGGQGWVRPGGGLWEDGRPRDLLTKVHAVANTVARLPANVRASYEMENYPFNLGAKSAAMTGLECLVTILATRLDGIMFDMLDHCGNSLDSYERWTEDLGKWMPLWNQATELVAGTIPIGWMPVYSDRHFQNHVGEKDLFSLVKADYKRPCALQLAGVPLTGFFEGAAGCLLCGPAAQGMSRQQLIALLDKPLIMDAEAAQRYLDCGLGERIGLLQVTERAEGVCEVFSEHPINGTTAGYVRAVTLKYYNACSHVLQPIEGISSLSTLTDLQKESLGSGLTLHEPAGAAPVAVISHLPWIHALSPQRMQQMRNLSDHMLKGRVPIRFEGDRAVVLWYRKGIEGRDVAIFFNAGFDPVTLSLEGTGLQSIAVSTPGAALTGANSLFLPGWSVVVARPCLSS